MLGPSWSGLLSEGRAKQTAFNSGPRSPCPVVQLGTLLLFRSLGGGTRDRVSVCSWSGLGEKTDGQKKTSETGQCPWQTLAVRSGAGCPGGQGGEMSGGGLLRNPTREALCESRSYSCAHEGSTGAPNQKGGENFFKGRTWHPVEVTLSPGSVTKCLHIECGSRI